jgi:hypothetical protein
LENAKIVWNAFPDYISILIKSLGLQYKLEAAIFSIVRPPLRALSHFMRRINYIDSQINAGLHYQSFEEFVRNLKCKQREYLISNLYPCKIPTVVMETLIVKTSL